MAAKLPSEPHLVPLHQASMHMLLGTTGLEPAGSHFEEAARVYSDLLERPDLSAEHRNKPKENHAIASISSSVPRT